MSHAPPQSFNPADERPAASEAIFRLIPALDSLRNYSLRSLAFDTMAGLTVAAVAFRRPWPMRKSPIFRRNMVYTRRLS